MQWGKKWPVQMNLPFFAVEEYVPGGGGPESGRKNSKKILLAGTGKKIYFSRVAILSISRDTLSDSIAKCFRACFPGVSHKYRAICCKM